MSLWRQLRQGLRGLIRGAEVDREIDDEVRHYYEQAVAEHQARGLTLDESRRLARRDLGNPVVVAEEVRSHGWERFVETTLADVRYAARRLWRAPGFTAIAVVTLALGIGASTAIFSAVNPVLFEPLPYPQASRILSIWYGAREGGRAEQAFGTFREIAERSHAFAALAVMKAWQPTWTGGDEPERFDGQRVSAGYFRVLGVKPALGREFDATEDRLNGPNVVILSDRLWRRRFGADAGVVGREVKLNDRPFMVVGIMPAGFENVLEPSAEVWAPLQYDASLQPDTREWGHHLRMIGRLGANANVEQARRDLDAIARNPVREFNRPSYASMAQGFVLNAVQDDVTRGVKPALVAVLGAVLLVLVMACVNVSNLLLARGALRRGEFAMRAALGAGRGRMVRQLLTESLLLAAAGGVAGLVVAEMGVGALVALSPAGLPRVERIAVNGAALGFAAVVATIVGVLVGLIPGVHASRGDLHPALQQTARSTAGTHRLTRRALVIAEVALALVLLAGAGLLLRSLERLFAVPAGFDASNLLTMQVQVSSTRRFPDDASIRRFYDRALEAVRSVPGVAGAALTSQLPLSGDSGEIYAIRLEHDADPRDRQLVYRYTVTPGYFELMGIPLVRGRLFDRGDVEGAAVRPVIVNESFAERKFPGQDPIGQRVRSGGATDRPWDVIVGVVGDVKQPSLAASQSNGLYMTTAQWIWADPMLWLVVRGHGDVTSLTPAIRNAIWSVDKDQPVVRVATMEALVATSASERRFALAVFEAFALVALVLAATGIYGVLSGSVSERTREIGVRSALGATRGSILALVLRGGITLTAVGIALGLGAALLASRLLVSLLFGVTRFDAVTYGGVVVLVVAVSAVACWLPAWRASRVDPLLALRSE